MTKVKTQTVGRLTDWDLAAIEEALLNGLPHADKNSLNGLIWKIRRADGGKLTRRVATETGKDAG